MKIDFWIRAARVARDIVGLIVILAVTYFILAL